MRVVFMGTPDFAVESLKALIQSKHEVCAVVTVPDKVQGRGLKLQPSSVKKFAENNLIPILQPESLKDTQFISKLKEFHADCFVVVAFKILPREVFTIPNQGTINVHGSLLPAYRGAAPINWAIINGETKSGVTTMFIDAKVDTGDILMQHEVNISEEMTAGELHDILAQKGALLLIKTLDKVEKNEIIPLSQDNSLASAAPKLTPEILKINFHKKASDVHNQIRGLSPYPAAYCTWNSRKIKIYKSKAVPEVKHDSEAGHVIHVEKDFLQISCLTGAINIFELQLEGKKRMNVTDFLNGYNIIIGDQFNK